MLIVFGIGLTGCATYQGYADLRQDNRAKLMNIELGMSKQLVLKQMDNNSYGEVSNPWKRELLTNNNTNESYDVLYYYTEYINYNAGENWESGVTPIILKDNKVIGTGWQFLDGLNIRKVSTFKSR
jgi:hypothetical protein